MKLIIGMFVWCSWVINVLCCVCRFGGVIWLSCVYGRLLMVIVIWWFILVVCIVSEYSNNGNVCSNKCIGFFLEW